MTEPRQETLSLIELLIENSIGTALPCNTEYIAREVDNYIDRLLKHKNRLPPETTHHTVTNAYVQGMAAEDY